MNFIKYSPSKKYLMFNHSDLKTLNQNSVQTDTISFPKSLYTAEPISYNYISDLSKLNSTNLYSPGGKHPLTYSTFGYNNGCEYGYCYGAQSGRNYNLPPQCHNNHKCN